MCYHYSVSGTVPLKVDKRNFTPTATAHMDLNNQPLDTNIRRFICLLYD